MSTRDKINSYLEQMDVETVFLDPPETFDQAIIGIAETAGDLCAIAYDRGLIIDAFVAQGMTREEAEGWFEFNTVRACAHLENPPVFIDTRFAE